MPSDSVAPQTVLAQRKGPRRWTPLVAALLVGCAVALSPALVTPAVALNKSEVFDKCAPATALVVLVTPQGTEIGSGIVIDSKGLLITNYHVIAAAASARLFAVFLYDPKERIVEEDLGQYIESHRAKALQPRVLRVDQENDIAILQLPERKGGYPTVAWGDSDAVRIGQDVVAIGNPQGLAWTLTSGSISAIRKNALQTETAINPGNSGGPLLDMEGRLVGINTYIRRNSQSLAFARPVNLVRAFAEQRSDLGHAISNAGPKGKGGSGGAATSLLVRRVIGDVEKRFPADQGKRVLCALFSAMTHGGRVVLSGVGDPTWLNDSLAAALAATAEADRPKAVQYIEQNFPLLVLGANRHLWLRSGARYYDVGSASAMDVDDITGQVWATDAEGNILAYDKATGKWTPSGVGPARDVEASDGVLYLLDAAGVVHAVRGGKALPLSTRPIRGSLQASHGVLYALDDRDGSLFRFRNGQWDNGGQAIATGVREVRANGSVWYGLDRDGRVYSGVASSYIDREGDLEGIWLMGDDLLGLGRDGLLYLWSAQARKWRALSS